MAAHSSVLAWRTPRMEEPGGLQPLGLQLLGQDTWVQSLGQEDPLEKEMAAHSSILAWKIPWTQRPGRVQSTGSQRVRQDVATEQ